MAGCRRTLRVAQLGVAGSRGRPAHAQLAFPRLWPGAAWPRLKSVQEWCLGTLVEETGRRVRLTQPPLSSSTRPSYAGNGQNADGAQAGGQAAA